MDETKDETKILSDEELSAITQAAIDQNKATDALSSINNIANQSTYAVNHFTDQLTFECERVFNAFLKKKVKVTLESTSHLSLSDMLKTNNDMRIFSIYHIQAYRCHGIFAMDMQLLHHAITILFGGESAGETCIQTPGETGLIVSDKICQLNLEALTNAFKEFGKLDCKTIKSTTISNFAPYISLDENFFVINFIFKYEEMETRFCFYLNDKVLNEMLPGKTLEESPSANSMWMQSMQEQISNSYVTARVQLDTVDLQLKDIFGLKEGDVIPINDPTQTYVCLNNVRLFKAQTGQSNGKRVIKIISQV